MAAMITASSASDHTMTAPPGRSSTAEVVSPAGTRQPLEPRAQTSPRVSVMACVANAGTIRLAKTSYIPTDCTDSVAATAKIL